MLLYIKRGISTVNSFIIYDELTVFIEPVERAATKTLIEEFDHGSD